MSRDRSASDDLQLLTERLGDKLLGSQLDLDQPTAVVALFGLTEAVRAIRDECGYQLLRSVTAVDFLPAEPRFQLVYHFVALPQSVLSGDPDPRLRAPPRELRLRAPVADAEPKPVAPTVTHLYPTANWHEREVFDMFGIEFAGHPDLRRILMPDDHEGHPLRKDAPLVYEEVAFTHNYDSIHSRKPRARR